MTYVKFGISCSPSKSWETLATEWVYLDRHCPQVDSLWLSDHLVRTFKPESPYRDAWSLLPALGIAAARCRIGALVTCNTFRHPSVLVRQALTNDEISVGRFIVGLGAGWYKPEHEILGIPFPKKPVQRLYNTLQLFELARSQEVIKYLETPTFTIKDWIIRPRPTGDLPILVGGHGKVILELAARYADIWNSFGTPEEMRERVQYLQWSSDNIALRYLDQRPIEKTIHIWQGLVSWDFWQSVGAWEDVVGMYSECGLTGFIFDCPKEGQWETFEKCLTTTTMKKLTGSPISTEA